MPKWLISMMVLVALGCARGTVSAQPAPEPQLEPAPQAQEQIEPREAETRHAEELRQRMRELADRERVQAQELRQRAMELGARAEGFGAGMVRVAKREPAAWLGVSTDRMPAALRQHLKMKHRGVGLLVQRVEPDSPAAKAGLQQYDILERLNDQWLINTEQFSVLIRMQNPGEEITLSVIREGQPQEIRATLVEKELPVLGAAQFDNIQLMPAEGVFKLANDGQVRVFMDQAAPPAPMFMERLNTTQNATVIVKDPEHSLKITTKDGKRTLEASDVNGVVVFSGPIDTEEQRAAIPEEITRKLEKFDDVTVIAPAAPAPPAPPAPPARGAREF